MSQLQIDRIVKRYGDVQVVKSVSLGIEDGEFVSLLGPSGCGKTTILRMVAGLIEPTSGAIKVGERDITQLPPNKRQMGLVFQSYALFPHLTVFENVAFGLRRQGQNGAVLEKRVLEALSMVRLEGFAQRYPRQLSGGQQQRVAMARAIAPRPTVLLFDEPLSNLDAKLRDEMQIELKRLQRELKITTLFVTHDQGEALSLSDRVCVMYDGVIQQFATPEEIYHRPATAFVAGFIGKPNKFSGEVVTRDGEGGTVRIGDGVTLRSDLVAVKPGAKVDVFIRQESISLGAPTPDKNALSGRIALRSFSGPHVQYVVRLGEGGVEVVVEVPSSGAESGHSQGDTAQILIAPRDVFVLPVGDGGTA